MLDTVLAKFTFSDQPLWTLGYYDYGLVVLSVVVAVISATVAMAISSHAVTASSKGDDTRFYMLASGSLALGGGVWAMHFIGMLAFNLCTVVEYRFIPTLLSMFPSVLAAGVALSLISRPELSRVQLVVGGVLMGSGIGAMHYLGMEAMDMAPILRYNPWLFALSVVVAVVLATLAIWVRSGLSHVLGRQLSLTRLNALAGLVMGLAISGMHYTGMLAARFIQPPGGIIPDYEIEQSLEFVGVITGVTLLLSITALCANLLYQYRITLNRAVKEETRLRAVMETAVDGIVSINRSGIVVGVNPAVEQILGWKPDELIGYNVNRLMADPYHSEHDGYIDNYARTGFAKIIGKGREVPALHKDGYEVPIRLAIGEVNLPSERLYVAFISDISQRRKMELALRENEAKFRSLITNIPGAAYRCLNNERWDMLFISDAIEEISGYKPKDFLSESSGVNLAELMLPEDAEHIVVESVNGQSFTFEYRLKDKAGNIRWILDHGTYIADEMNPSTGWIDGFLMDITDRVRLEMELRSSKEAAEQASQMKSTFLANMSHEIRTPMNAITGFTDILLQTPLNHQQEKYLTTVKNSANSLLHLLNDILDSAKLEKGKLEVSTTVFSLSQLLDIVMSTFWVQAHKKDLDLQLEVSPELSGYFLGAEDRVRQVLVNMVGNAVKFTEEGRVTVSAERYGEDEVLFKVVDTGIGIKAEALATIFEPFQQADGSMSRNYGGTGLGTTITKQLVELMGGSIDLQSEEGVGTEVSFRIPLPAAAAPPEAESSQLVESHLPKLAILITDDVELNLDLLEIILVNHGHDVTRATNGQEAFDTYTQGQFDLLLMDVRMPEVDGLTASRMIRSWEIEQQQKAVPIIALTASVQDEERIATSDAGMDGFQTKPIQVHALFAEIARVLGFDSRNLVVPDEIEGRKDVAIDERKGIDLWGNKVTYLAEVKRFITSQGYCTEQLHNYVKASQWMPLEERVHRLKGVAANLALPLLEESLVEFETQLKAKNTSAYCGCIQQIRQAFKVLEENFAKLAEDSAESAAIEKTYNHQQVDHYIDQLLEAAENSEWNDDALKGLQEATPTAYLEMVESLVDAFNDFEFETAKHLLLKYREVVTR